MDKRTDDIMFYCFPIYLKIHISGKGGNFIANLIFLDQHEEISYLLDYSLKKIRAN